MPLGGAKEPWMSIGIKATRSSWLETVIIVVEALTIAMFVRVFFYQPFNIPSGSSTAAEKKMISARPTKFS